MITTYMYAEILVQFILDSKHDSANSKTISIVVSDPNTVKMPGDEGTSCYHNLKLETWLQGLTATHIHFALKIILRFVFCFFYCV